MIQTFSLLRTREKKGKWRLRGKRRERGKERRKREK